MKIAALGRHGVQLIELTDVNAAKIVRIARSRIHRAMPFITVTIEQNDQTWRVDLGRSIAAPSKSGARAA